MDKFIDCLVDKDFSVLGKGSEYELSAAWMDIYNEFSSLRQSAESTQLFELMKEIFSLEQKIKIIEKCVEILWITYSRDIANELKMMGFNIRLDWSDKPVYFKELNSIVSKTKTTVLKLEQKQKELNKLTEKQKGIGYSRKDFISINTNLARFMNFHINNAIITVADWCDMLNKYDAYCEVLNNQNNNLATQK